MTEKIATAPNHPDDVESDIVEPDFDDENDEKVEIADDELDGIDFDEIDPEDVPVLEAEPEEEGDE